jgi:hypothetical protein
MHTSNPNTMFQFSHEFNQAPQLIKRIRSSMPINKLKIKVIQFKGRLCNLVMGKHRIILMLNLG